MKKHDSYDLKDSFYLGGHLLDILQLIFTSSLLIILSNNILFIKIRNFPRRHSVLRDHLSIMLKECSDVIQPRWMIKMRPPPPPSLPSFLDFPQPFDI